MLKKELATIEIKSIKGNYYIYDSKTNLIFQNVNGFYDIIKYYHKFSKNELVSKLSQNLNKKDVEANFEYIELLIENFKAFYFDEDEISRNNTFQEKNEFSNNISNISHIVLELTQSCNLRCKYCLYSESENNKDFRVHNEKNMSFEIAKKSLDYYFSLIYSKYRVNKLGRFFVNFYGGEPLLNFDLIKKVVSYVNIKISEKPLKNKLYFTITTNGLLLKDEIMRFLIKNNFLTAISLDGPEPEHDKNRVTGSGKGSFRIIWNNLKKIIEYYREYYENNIVFLPTLNQNHDPLVIDNFFKKLLKNRYDRLKVALLRDENLGNTYKVNKNFFKLKNIFIREITTEEPLTPFFRSLFTSYYKIALNRNFLGDNGHYTSACFPSGFRFFVSSDGYFHICEKINPHFSIGNFKVGIQKDKVSQIFEQYNNHIVSKCNLCLARHFCSVCFASAAKRNKFNSDTLCKEQIKLSKVLLCDVISMQEENQNAFNKSEIDIEKRILEEIVY